MLIAVMGGIPWYLKQIDIECSAVENITIYVIEIKFSREPVTNKVIREMQNKIKKLKIPRGFVCIPVLIVAGDVSVYVFEGGYFYKVIDLRELLNK